MHAGGLRKGRRPINRTAVRSLRRLRPTLKPSTEIVSKAQEFVDIYRFPPVRPAPIYPTPQVDKPAAKCRKDVCLLPDCSCGGADIPGMSDDLAFPHQRTVRFRDSMRHSWT